MRGGGTDAATPREAGATTIGSASSNARNRFPPARAPNVVELYTSEGCSSCPPADRWLSTLKAPVAQGRVVVQAFHVGYWDYIGWKDRFASKEGTERQRLYARALKQRYVYTPEMVVDGRAHEPGTKEGKIEGLLADETGRWLVNRRRAGTHMAGRWEFPGGKAEPGEDPRAAPIMQHATELLQLVMKLGKNGVRIAPDGEHTDARN